MRDIGEAILSTRGATAVRVEDVASVHETNQRPLGYVRVDRQPSVFVRIIEEPGTNHLRVADAVKARVAQLERLSPSGAEFQLVDDESEEIRRQFTNLRHRAVSGGVVIFAVLWLFLRSLRSVALVFASIAFSVAIAVNLVYLVGSSLNLLTLTGLALGFGLVVDNSIVVLENVYRHWQCGESPLEAAKSGASEVVFPIMASTATTLVVLVPFVYLQGELRVYYVPLAIVVGLTLTASVLVAFTLVPPLSCRLLAVAGGPRPAYPADGDRLARGASAGSKGPCGRGALTLRDAATTVVSVPRPAVGAPLYVRFYSALVVFTLARPWVNVGAGLVCLVCSAYLFDTYVERGHAWGGEGATRSRIDIVIELPRGSNLERTDRLTRSFEDELAALPGVDYFTAAVGEQTGRIQVFFADSLEHTGVPAAIEEQMVSYGRSFTGVDVSVYGLGPSFSGGGRSTPGYTITVQGYDYERVRSIAEDLGRRLLRFSRIRGVDANSSRRFARERPWNTRCVSTVIHLHYKILQLLTSYVDLTLSSGVVAGRARSRSAAMKCLTW